MFCSRCGKETGPDAAFCQYCGAAQTPVPPRGSAAGSGVLLDAPASSKRLRRSRFDKKIAGVCGGLANYLDIDPTIVRVVWALCFFLGGTGLLAYIIFWIAVPEEA